VKDIITFSGSLCYRRFDNAPLLTQISRQLGYKE